MMASQLSSVTATRGVAVKAPRATASKARVATRVQAVSPPTQPPAHLGFLVNGHASASNPTPVATRDHPLTR